MSVIKPGVFAVNVDSMVNILSKAYISLIKSNTPLNKFPSVMLWGPPGVGKSQGVRQIATKIEEKTSKRVIVTDVRLLLFNPVDLRGIPTSNEDKTLAVWLKPKIFQMDESSDVVNILFLDEISAAPQSVQAAAYQITLDRTVGEHKLPENCIVLAAGNRVTDRSVAYTMPKALANRLCHLEIESNIESWQKWAAGAGINGKVLGFLKYNPSMLMEFEAHNDGLAFPTPRSWEMVSNVLNHVTENVDEVFSIISGCIGDEAAYSFKTWTEIYNRIPEMKSIFSGEPVSTPRRPEALYALTSQIVGYAHKHHSPEEIKNVLAYSENLPTEFRNNLFEDLLQIKEIRRTLYNNNTYYDWFMRTGRYWEDYGIIE